MGITSASVRESHAILCLRLLNDHRAEENGVTFSHKT